MKELEKEYNAIITAENLYKDSFIAMCKKLEEHLKDYGLKEDKGVFPITNKGYSFKIIVDENPDKSLITEAMNTRIANVHGSRMGQVLDGTFFTLYHEIADELSENQMLLKEPFLRLCNREKNKGNKFGDFNKKLYNILKEKYGKNAINDFRIVDGNYVSYNKLEIVFGYSGDAEEVYRKLAKSNMNFRLTLEDRILKIIICPYR